MSYGCGNYMCRGDPGFFSNVFRAITHVVGGAVGGFLTGGPVGAIGGAIHGAIGGTASNIGSSTLEAGDSSSALTPALRAQHAAALARGAVVHPVTGKVVGGKRRMMNWANHRALSRAERRIHLAVKHFSKYIRWVHPGRLGHAAPKFGKHRASPYPKRSAAAGRRRGVVGHITTSVPGVGIMGVGGGR